MAKLTRILHKIFGASATSDQMSVYGSYKNGSTTPSLDPAVISGQANWLQGMPGGVIGRNSPLIEEMNGLFFHNSRQLGYLLQQGIAEYNSETEYYTDSYVTTNNLVYRSIRDNHIGYPVTSLTTWELFPKATLPSYATTTAATTARAVGEGFKFYNSTTKRFMSYLNSLWNYDDENSIEPRYASTTAFVAARGGPVEGNKFYDTALYCFRYYLNGVWQNRGDYVSCNIGSPIGSSSASIVYIPSCTITLPVGKWKLKVNLNVSVQASVNTSASSFASIWLTTDVTTTDIAHRSVFVTSPTTPANCNFIVGAPLYFTKELTLTVPTLFRLHFNTDSYALISAGSDCFSAERIL